VLDAPLLQFEAAPAAVRPAVTPPAVSVAGDANAAEAPEDAGLGGDLRSRERRLILDALREGQGSRKLAAERLGISARTLRYKLARMREAGVDVPAANGADE